MTTRGTAVPYFQSLNRPILILGVDRTLFFLCIGLCLPVAFSGHLTPLMDIAAALVFAISYVIALIITHADPKMLILYRRHIRYHAYYSAQPSTHAKGMTPPSSVPVYNGKQGML